MTYSEQSSFCNPSVALPTSQFILLPFRCFTYATAHSSTLLSIYLHLSSFSNTSVASHTSQLILQPFFRLVYVKGSSLTSPGEPPMGTILCRGLKFLHDIYENFDCALIQVFFDPNYNKNLCHHKKIISIY